MDMEFTQAEAARIKGMKPQNMSKEVKAKHYKSRTEGSHVFVTLSSDDPDVIAYLQKKKERESSGVLSFDEARAKMMNAKAKREELKLAEDEGKMKTDAFQYAIEKIHKFYSVPIMQFVASADIPKRIKNQWNALIKKCDEDLRASVLIDDSSAEEHSDA